MVKRRSALELSLVASLIFGMAWLAAEIVNATPAQCIDSCDPIPSQACVGPDVYCTYCGIDATDCGSQPFVSYTTVLYNVPMAGGSKITSTAMPCVATGTCTNAAPVTNSKCLLDNCVWPLFSTCNPCTFGVTVWHTFPHCTVVGCNEG